MYVFEIYVVWPVKMLVFGLKWFLFVFLLIHIFWPKCCVTIVTSSQSAFYPVKTLLWDVLGIVYAHVCACASQYSAIRWRALKMESENARKPVIMNLHVLTVAHYCRLFASECIFIRLNCSGVVRRLLSWDFYTRRERQIFEIFGILSLEGNSRERRKISYLNYARFPIALPVISV